MSKVFQLQNRIGSYKDSQTGNVMTNNNGVEIKKTSKGRAYFFDSTSSEYLSEASTIRQYPAYSMEIWVKFDDISSRKTALSLGTTGDSDVIGIGVQSGIGTDNHLLYGNFTGSWRVADSLIVPVVGKWYHCIAINTGTQMEFYVDNILKATTAGSGAMGAMESVWIGARHDSFNYNFFDGNLSDPKVFDHALNATERQNLYNDFLKSRNILVPIRNFKQEAYKIDVDKDSSLKACYDFGALKQNQIAYDETNNHNDGTISGAMLSGDGLSFDGTDDKVDCGNIGNITQVEMFVKPKTITEYLFQTDAANYVYINTGTITYSGIMAIATYVNGIASTSIPTADKEYYVVCQFAQEASANFEIGTDGSNHFEGGMKMIAVSNANRSATEIKDHWNKIAQQVELNIDGTNWDTTGNTLASGKVGDFDIQSGSFKASEDSDDKYIECVTDGQIKVSVDLSRNIGNGFIHRIDGDLSSDAGNNVDAATNVSYLDKALYLSMTSGQKLRNLIIKKGELL